MLTHAHIQIHRCADSHKHRLMHAYIDSCLHTHAHYSIQTHMYMCTYMHPQENHTIHTCAAMQHTCIPMHTHNHVHMLPSGSADLPESQFLPRNHGVAGTCLVGKAQGKQDPSTDWSKAVHTGEPHSRCFAPTSSRLLCSPHSEGSLLLRSFGVTFHLCGG